MPGAPSTMVKIGPQLAIIIGCVSAALIIAFTTDTIPASGSRGCDFSKPDDKSGGNDLKMTRRTPRNCDKRLGSKATASGKTWNISLFEGCAIDYLMETYPAWRGGKDGVHFWSSKNLSHFNIFDFQSAPAWFLSTDKYGAQTHLGYNESNIGGFKDVVGNGARKAMYARQWIFYTAFGLWILAVIMSLVVRCMQVSDMYKYATALVWAVWFAFALFAIASFLYQHLYTTGAVSMLPDDPVEAAKHPDGQGYELIPMKNITFKEHPTRCPKGVALALNRDAGAFFHDSTGIHGATLKNTILATGILIILPIAIILLMQTAEFSVMDTDEPKKETKMHFLGLGYFILFISLQFVVTYSSDMDNRCGNADPQQLAGLGATPGSYSEHPVSKTAETIIHAVALSGALIIVVVDAMEMTDKLVGAIGLGGKAFKLTVAFVTLLLIVLEAYIFTIPYAINASDLCTSPLTANGRAVSTVQLFGVVLVMLLFTVYQLFTSVEIKFDQFGLASKYSAVKTNKNNRELEMSMI